MKSISIPYRQENHGSFDDEWAVHKKVSGWWYITGYFTDPTDPERLYSFQFTVIKAANIRDFTLYPPAGADRYPDQ